MIQSTATAELSTTVVTIVEIQCGIERQRTSNPEYAAATQAWLSNLLSARDIQVHTLDVAAALLLGRMHETPALRNFVVSDPRQKQPKTAADLALAAIAIAQGAVVATGNVAHFAEIHEWFPLPGLFNPFKDEWVVEPPSPPGGDGPP